MPNKNTNEGKIREKDRRDIIGYAVRPLPKRRKLRDFRSKGADYIRSIFAYGREASTRVKAGCLAILVFLILLITLVLYLVAAPNKDEKTPADLSAGVFYVLVKKWV
jgi:hypothetical protein